MNPRVVLALLLLGVLLGPATGVLNDATLRSLAPVLALCLGWTGAAFGSRFQWRFVRRIPRSVWLGSAAQAGAAFLAVAAGAALLALAVPALRAAWRPVVPVVLALGAIAAVAGPGAVDLAARAAGAGHALAKALATAATLDAVLGTTVLMLALAIDHPRGPLAGPIGAVGWLLLTLGSGVLVALLFLGLASLREPHGITLALLGVVLLGAGAGYAAGLSPFVVCAVAAGVIANRSPERRVVAAQLRVWEPVLYAVFLILAGALLGLRTWWIVPAAALLAAIRVAARWAAGRLGSHADLGLAGIAQGGVALALGINFLLIYRDSAAPAPEAVLTTVVLGVVLAQLAAPFLMRRALQAPELTASPAPAEVS